MKYKTLLVKTLSNVDQMGINNFTAYIENRYRIK